MDKEKAQEYASLISEITGMRNLRTLEEISALFDAGKENELDVYELRMYARSLVRSGKIDQAEQISALISDEAVKTTTLLAITQGMISAGLLARAKESLESLGRQTNSEITRSMSLATHAQLAEAYYQAGKPEQALALLTQAESFQDPAATDYEGAEDLFRLAEAWQELGDNRRALERYTNAFHSAQRSFNITQAAGGNGYDEGKLSVAIIRTMVKYGMMAEAKLLAGSIASQLWSEKALELFDQR